MKIIRNIIAITLLLAITVAFPSCSFLGKDVEKDPITAIKDTYGNNTYRIDFYSDGLEEPLQSLTYTAKKIPLLPTPIRIGYIFEGWYLDEKLTIPYTDNILYLYMRDVVLYPKWSKEDFSHDGVYDIDFEASIVENSVKKGEKTDEYGGFTDFSDCISIEETCIQKTDGSLLLKLQYDSEVTVPFGQPATFSVAMSSDMPSHLKIDTSRTIDAWSDPIKTIYIQIDKHDLSKPIVFDIGWKNWKEKGLDSDDRDATQTFYKVSFKITNIIGFNRPFVDIDVPLDDGFYLAKTYFRKVTNEESMGNLFNPVYSYISAKDGKYTLIKPFMPYAGMVGMELGQTGGHYELQDYYDRIMSLTTMQLCYPITDINNFGSEKQESDFYPELYEGGKYLDFSYEFHKDTGRFYAVYDLGKNLQTSYMITIAVTGFMEVNGAMGYNDQIMTIDYDHIVKLAEIDYKPLEGQSYEYQNDMRYYPGNTSDLDKNNTLYEACKESYQTNMVNFFYSAGKMKDSKVVVTPVGETASQKVCDSRYKIARFKIQNYIYDYDVKRDGSLFADTMISNTFGAAGLRERLLMENGKSFDEGETVWLDALFAEKVDMKYDFGNVSYKAYPIKNNEIDFSKPFDVKKSFVFKDDVAIVFEFKNEFINPYGLSQQDNCYSVVRVTHTSAPDEIKIKKYDENAHNIIGTFMDMPQFSYKWKNKKGNLYSDFYSADGEREADPTKVVYYYVDEYGRYNLQTFGMDMTKIKLEAPTVIIQFQISNTYGEVYNHYITVKAEKAAETQNKTYTITSGPDGTGELIYSGYLYFDEEERRKPVLARPSDIVSRIKNIDCNDYYLNIQGVSTKAELYEYKIYMKERTEYVKVDSTMTKEQVVKNLQNVIGPMDYAYIEFYYSSGKDIICREVLTNVTLNGSSSMNLINYDTYFTDTEYSFKAPVICGLDGTIFDQFYAGVYGDRSDAKFFDDGEMYRITFLKEKVYSLYYSGSMLFDSEGNYAFEGIDDYIHFSFSGECPVVSRFSDVEITFVTDKNHPFEGGSLSKTVVYNLADNIVALDKKQFEDTKHILFGWTPNVLYKPSNKKVVAAGQVIEEFIRSYNSNKITLYAIWDEGVEITAKFFYDDGSGRIEDIITKKYFLLTDREAFSGYGTYVVSIEGLNMTVPEGFVVDRYEGGVLRRTESAAYTHQLDNITEGGYFYVVLRKKIQVQYNINEDYSGRVIGNDTVLDKKKIEKPELKMNVTCTVEGYSFKYWAVKEANGDMVEFDIYTNKITVEKAKKYGDDDCLKLYAVFENSEGDKIW